MPNTSFVKVLLTAATTTVALYALASGDIIIPSKFYNDLPLLSSEKYSWEGYVRSPYYTLKVSDLEFYNQIEILHQFASNILEKAEDLDPAFAKIINENFSKLV